MTAEHWIIIVFCMVIMYVLGTLTIHLVHKHQREKRIAEMAKAQEERRRQRENQKGRRSSA